MEGERGSMKEVDDFMSKTITPCGLCRSSDVLSAIGEKTLNNTGCLYSDFDALRSLPQGSSLVLSGLVSRTAFKNLTVKWCIWLPLLSDRAGFLSFEIQ